jgi:hypothetical protein
MSAHIVVRCSGLSDDGLCGREQAIETRAEGHGVRVAAEVSVSIADWLSSIGWRCASGQWLCPFCAGWFS